MNNEVKLHGNNVTNIKCPVCLNVEGGSCKRYDQGKIPWFDCSICRNYETELSLHFQIQKGAYNVGKWELNREQRAILSNCISNYNNENYQKLCKGEAKIFRITTQMLDSLRSNRRLPIRND